MIFLHHNVHTLTHIAKLNSNIFIPIKENHFFAAQKLLSRRTHYHKQVKYEARTSVACMIFVMDKNFSMLSKTSHASPGDGGGIFGLGIISGLDTYVNLCTCINIFERIYIFFFIFATLHFSVFKSGSIKNTAVPAYNKNESDFCN